jgi:hypothetical protein
MLIVGLSAAHATGVRYTVNGSDCWSTFYGSLLAITVFSAFMGIDRAYGLGARNGISVALAFASAFWLGSAPAQSPLDSLHLGCGVTMLTISAICCIVRQQRQQKSETFSG